MEVVQNVSSVQVVERRRGIIATALGQFATRKFWGELFSMVIREALSSFILSLGGTLVHYVRNKATTDSNSIRNITGNGVGAPQPTSSPTSAFANGYTPKPTYSQPTSHPGNYPGFG